MPLTITTSATETSIAAGANTLIRIPQTDTQPILLPKATARKNRTADIATVGNILDEYAFTGFPTTVAEPNDGMSGYYITPHGFIVQYGTIGNGVPVVGTPNKVTVVFPIAFPTSAYVLVANGVTHWYKLSEGSNGDPAQIALRPNMYWSNQTMVQIAIPSLTGFTMGMNIAGYNGDGRTIQWMAIGR